MESLSETTWDVIICGTGLQQSLLALALSRSGKQILHLDPNEYYGGPEAAFSLQETEAWVEENASATGDRLFTSASITKPAESTSLSFPRSYSLTLSPQLIHTRSALLSQLVSSRAYRQVEFLAVGSFFIFQPSKSDGTRPSIAPIPSTREAVFSSSAIPARAKRSLMKFLKFVLEYDAEPQTAIWQPHELKALSSFLSLQFNLDAELQYYIVTLTLSLNGLITVKDGLAAIHRHLTSMGMFGPGFAAVYPKWGGSSEIAQVACRAGAVGGGVYMLGTGAKDIRVLDSSEDGAKIEVDLTSNVTVKTRLLVQGSEKSEADSLRVSRLIAIVASPLRSLFEAVLEGAPTPAVAVIAFPAGSIADEASVESVHPIYVFAHSSETGECPTGQSVLYFATLATPSSKALLEKALSSLLTALGDGEETPTSTYKLHYDQSHGGSDLVTEGDILTFPSLPLDLAFNDTVLEPVKAAWARVVESDEQQVESEYMKFEDREGVGDDDDIYDEL